VPVPAKVVVVALDSCEELKKRCCEFEKANWEFYKHIDQATLKVLQKKCLARQLKNHVKCFQERLATERGKKNEDRKAVVAATGSHNKELHKQMAHAKAKATWDCLFRNNDRIQEELVGVRIRNRTLASQYCRAQAELAEANRKPCNK